MYKPLLVHSADIISSAKQAQTIAEGVCFHSSCFAFGITESNTENGRGGGGGGRGGGMSTWEVV